MQHDRHLLGTILSRVGQAEVVRQLEVKLDRTALPLSSKCILDMKVDLRAIERAVALIDLLTILAILLVEDFL